MSEVVTIEDTEMQIREYDGQRVVTFKDIDTVHRKKRDTSRRTFNKYKDRFSLGEDYIVLSLKSEADKENSNRTDSPIRNISIPNRGITVLTESGYLLLVKVFDDDLAWKVQRQLVNSYFRLKEIKEEFNPPIEKFPEEQPRITYQTSSTPVPKNPSWQARNRRRINALCEKANTSVSSLYHHVLLRLGEEYDLNAANRIYEEELGHCPKYAMDIVSYFPELARMADAYLDKLEEVTEKQSNNE